MALFARLNGRMRMKLNSTLITLAMGLMAATSAVHAEKYCKSVDQNGNASYTLAPESGCKKQFKTVGIHKFMAPMAAPSTTVSSSTNINSQTNSAPTAPTTNPTTETNSNTATKSSSTSTNTQNTVTNSK